MSTLTPNLNLVLPIGVEKVSRQIINTNMTLIDTAVGGKVNVSDIVDDLVTNDPTKVLSAAQGYALNSKIGALEKNNFSNEIDISSYTINNKFTVPSDGYVCVVNNSGQSGVIAINGSTNDVFAYSMGGSQGRWMAFVKKGMRLYGSGTANAMVFNALS